MNGLRGKERGRGNEIDSELEIEIEILIAITQVQVVQVENVIYLLFYFYFFKYIRQSLLFLYFYGFWLIFFCIPTSKGSQQYYCASSLIRYTIAIIRNHKLDNPMLFIDYMYCFES